ncbi:hypothetical protein PR202_gb25088 [Eleusine coracana subsp. coracana]|uniref:Uncharacterized protein n=1 Tax=Eleusine coracana subsp. coracana TaxID=191504 RepID=A0AAV5FNB0_ELECO|nr:hypothetical protein PR202_gb25088 [Eleusine coracana subsp. coracana]
MAEPASQEMREQAFQRRSWVRKQQDEGVLDPIRARLDLLTCGSRPSTGPRQPSHISLDPAYPTSRRPTHRHDDETRTFFGGTVQGRRRSLVPDTSSSPGFTSTSPPPASLAPAPFPPPLISSSPS